MGFLFELLFQAIAEFVCGAIYRAIGAAGCMILCLPIFAIVGLIIWAAL